MSNEDPFKKWTGKAQEDVAMPNSPLLKYLRDLDKTDAQTEVRPHWTVSAAHEIMLGPEKPEDKWKLLREKQGKQYRMPDGEDLYSVETSIWDEDTVIALRCALELFRLEPALLQDEVRLQAFQNLWSTLAAASVATHETEEEKLRDIRLYLENLLVITGICFDQDVPLGDDFLAYRAQIPALDSLARGRGL